MGPHVQARLTQLVYVLIEQRIIHVNAQALATDVHGHSDIFVMRGRRCLEAFAENIKDSVASGEAHNVVSG